MLMARQCQGASGRMAPEGKAERRSRDDRDQADEVPSRRLSASAAPASTLQLARGVGQLNRAAPASSSTLRQVLGQQPKAWRPTVRPGRQAPALCHLTRLALQSAGDRARTDRHLA